MSDSTSMYGLQDSLVLIDGSADEVQRLRSQVAELQQEDPYYNPAFGPDDVHFIPPVYLSDGTIA